MICRACGAPDDDFVTGTDKYPNHNFRGRRCKVCGFKWSTIEMAEDMEAMMWAAKKASLQIELLMLQVKELEAELARRKNNDTG